jgi:adenosylcobinamide kinase/adenosylcobinamide-phosphate guanylyltransferase
MSNQITLVLGGQRSGKSKYAEGLIEAQGGGLYLATAQVFDDEMKGRIDTHQQRRGDKWITLEEPLNIASIILREAKSNQPVLVDCLTLWLSNLIHEEQNIEAQTESLIIALHKSQGPVVLVSNEVGQGVIPDNALARKFVDCAGRMNQVIAEAADRVVWVTAGIPQMLKDEKK